MTVAAAFWSRKYPNLPAAVDRLFEVEPGSKSSANATGNLTQSTIPRWFWSMASRDRRNRATCLVLPIARSLRASTLFASTSAIAAARPRSRPRFTIPGSAEISAPSSWNSSSGDQLPEIFFAGYSMGGNLVLKMEGELGTTAPDALRGICAVCCALDLVVLRKCYRSSRNILYRRYFVSKLKHRFRRRSRNFPEKYADPGLDRVHTIRDFDDIITAPNCGYQNAADYYYRASALRVISGIRVPTLLIVAEDDPMVPPRPFPDPSITGNPHIRVVIGQVWRPLRVHLCRCCRAPLGGSPGGGVLRGPFEIASVRADQILVAPIAGKRILAIRPAFQAIGSIPALTNAPVHPASPPCRLQASGQNLPAI